MTASIDPNLAATQSAAAAAWAAANASRAQVVATYIAATGSFLVAVVTGVLTLRESLKGRNARRFAAIEGLRAAAGMIALTWSTIRSAPVDQVVSFDKLKAFLKIALDSIAGSAAQHSEDRQLISLVHRIKRATDGFAHLMDRVERASPKLTVGDFLRQHGDWEEVLKPMIDDVNELES